jgi:hypothetical protein
MNQNTLVQLARQLHPVLKKRLDYHAIGRMTYSAMEDQMVLFDECPSSRGDPDGVGYHSWNWAYGNWYLFGVCLVNAFVYDFCIYCYSQRGVPQPKNWFTKFLFKRGWLAVK